MRILSTAAFATVLLPAATQAQDKAPAKKPDSCFYTLANGKVVNVPVGLNVCRRDQYALLMRSTA